MRNHLESLLFFSIGFFIRLFPLSFAQFIGKMLGTFGYLFFRKRKTIAVENLRYAFPEKNEQEIRSITLGAMRSYAISISEFLWFPRLTPKKLRKLIRYRNIDKTAEVYSRNRNLILLSGHFGNWELAALSMGHFSGYPVTIIVQRQRNPYVDREINHYRCLWGNSVVPMQLSVREILKTLSNGRTVGILADQSAGKDGLYVPFFGRVAATHEGPAVFSLRTGAPILMVFLIRQKGGKYEGVVEEVKSDDLDAYSEENVAELTRRHVAMLEKYVRMYPEQWLWMHRRWKHVPSDSTTRDSLLKEKAELTSDAIG